MEGLVDLSLFEWNPTGNSEAQGVSTGSAEYYQPCLSATREYYAPSPRQEASSSREMDDLQEAIRQSINESTYQSETRHGATMRDEGDIRETIVDAPRRREATTKPLPLLPRTAFCQKVADDGSECILKRIKRTANDQGIPSPGSLLQRRNGSAPPQLTLSVPLESSRPQQNNNASRNPPSMVWMPDEQIWLIVGEAEQRTSRAAEFAYPTPPAYTPRAFARSEPSSRANSTWEITPPQTPIQSQLQSLLQPRDEERLSPLFQEAMNSVPMNDHFDLPPPPSYEGTMHNTSPPAPFSSRPYTSTSEHFLSTVSSSIPSSHSTSPVVHRAQTTGSQRPRVRSDTLGERTISQRSYSSLSGPARPSNGGRSWHSTSSSRSYQTDPDMNPNPYQPGVSSTSSCSWHGIAQRLARPRSST